ncbi:hypothetical protein Q1695_008145 [Nippostrongylus brasiliensis]|nr:hypothetical protein Q1695_008145 [Nippostrongylus brasiliensis]
MCKFTGGHALGLNRPRPWAVAFCFDGIMMMSHFKDIGERAAALVEALKQRGRRRKSAENNHLPPARSSNRELCLINAEKNRNATRRD